MALASGIRDSAEKATGGADCRVIPPLTTPPAFAWNTTWAPGIAGVVTVTVCRPALAPSVHFAVAWPSASVVVVTAESDAVGSDVVHVTATSETGSLRGSVIFTTRAVGRSAPLPL